MPAQSGGMEIFMIYVLLTDGFEDIEALAVVDILRRAELDVKTVGVGGKNIVSAHSVTVVCDELIDELNVAEMDMLILPGGPGHTDLDASEKVHSLIRYAHEHDKFIAAICAAPSIIGKMGLLKGKNYTCYPGFEDKVIGGIHSDGNVAADGKIITGKGPGAACDFGFKIVEIFRGKIVADDLKAQMQF